MRKRGLRNAILPAIVVLALGACEPAQEQAGPPPDQPPPPVDVAAPIVDNIVDWDEFTGRFEAVERVEIRARVSGYLDAVHFDDGEIVEKGELLFTIDQRPFKAEVERVRAEIEQARTRLELAETELKRAERLFKNGNISEETVDERRATRDVERGQITALTARLRLAELDLEFTEVRAPIAGRISERQIDVGNLVSGGSAQSSLLTTIVTLDPIYFVFDASEADYLRYVRLHREGRRRSSRQSANPVYVKLMDETAWLRLGYMDFVDNELNTNAGTIRGRAVFDNPDHLLAPGLFGRLRLVGSGEYEAIMVPDRAVISDQSNKILYTVDAENTVVAKRVTLGSMNNGLRVISSGLEPGDRVIVNGTQRARPGSKVTPEEIEIDAIAAEIAGKSSP